MGPTEPACSLGTFALFLYYAANKIWGSSSIHPPKLGLTDLFLSSGVTLFMA